MIIQVPVEVLCKGCEGCPRLDIRAEELYAAGHMVSRDLACRHLNDCLMVREAMERKETEGEK